MSKNANENGKSSRDNGNGNGYGTFSCMPKFPSVDSRRIQSNNIYSTITYSY